jgi:hypothetical protein
MSFSVDKWYVDLVTGDGIAVVGYVLTVRWLGIDLRMASRLVVERAGRREERSALGEPGMPALAAGGLSWTSDALGLQATWQALDAPIAATLLTSPAGSIEWSCVMPRARATAITAAAHYEGLGYAEHLRLTLPPWALPFHRLQWGRHLSDRHALVWIDWDDGRVLRHVWLDGDLQPSARLGASGLAGLTDGRALRWDDHRDLTRRSVGDAIADAAPALAAHVAGRLAGMREHKQLSQSTLVDADERPLDAGWSIHEVVTW